MVGGFYAYSDARYPFQYFEDLIEMFKMVSKDRYNIEINA